MISSTCARGPDILLGIRPGPIRNSEPSAGGAARAGPSAAQESPSSRSRRPYFIVQYGGADAVSSINRMCPYDSAAHAGP